MNILEATKDRLLEEIGDQLKHQNEILAKNERQLTLMHAEQKKLNEILCMVAGLGVHFGLSNSFLSEPVAKGLFNEIRRLGGGSWS
jgi:hypothetical protein